MMVRSLFALVALSVVPAVNGEVNYQPPELVSEDGKLDVTLDVAFGYSLNGTRFSPQFNGGPIGPTLRVKPGDILTVTLNNNLPPSSDYDRELMAYIQDPMNEMENDANVTIIYNRLSEIGNVYDPKYGYWGFNYVNLHFHGAGFSPKEEDIRNPLDGGESKTYVHKIPEDHPPGLVWYHSHVHGIGEYEFLSGLFGFMVIEGTANDITTVPEIGGATEIFMLMSEFLGDPESGIPAPFFPIVMAFGWSSVVNGYLAEETHYEFTQGETVLFRGISAAVEATLRIYLEGEGAPQMMMVGEDGFPVVSLESTDTIIATPGGRVEFMTKFDVPGNYTLRRAPWTIFGLHGEEACNAAFGVPAEACISYDVDMPLATITVLPSDEPIDAELPASVPEYDSYFKGLEEMEVVAKREVRFEQAEGFPIFQINYTGPFVPPGTGFGINNRLVTPHFSHGDIIAGTCEEWTVSQHPPSAEHALHIHTNPFLVTHMDGVPVEEPFWRDTMSLFGHNVTIKTCFNRLEPGDYVFVHCHAMTHVGVGMGAYYSVVSDDEITGDDIAGNVTMPMDEMDDEGGEEETKDEELIGEGGDDEEEENENDIDTDPGTAVEKTAEGNREKAEVSSAAFVSVSVMVSLLNILLSLW